MSELNPVRIAVIGAGAMGRNHIRFVTEEPEAELVAIADAFEGARATAEAAAQGKPLTQETVDAFANAILSDINPRDSWRASKAFRQHIALEIAKRCLVKSIELAGGELA